MATFKIVSRTTKEYNVVQIRITHKSAADYIRTEITVHKSGLNKKKEVTDHFVLAQCAVKIRNYYLKLNTINSDLMTVREIKNFLSEKNDAISFTDFANNYTIKKMLVSMGSFILLSIIGVFVYCFYFFLTQADIKKIFFKENSELLLIGKDNFVWDIGASATIFFNNFAKKNIASVLLQSLTLIKIFN